MTRAIGRAVPLALLVLGFQTATASAQDPPPGGSGARFSLEAAAGLQMRYDGTTQSVAFGFAPTRELTLLVSAERSQVDDKFELYEHGYSRERGASERFVAAELRYAFLPGLRVSPYVLAGTGRGRVRPNVSEFFPTDFDRDIRLIYFGGGVRIPIQRWLDAFADVRFLGFAAEEGDGIGVRYPARAGLAVRF